jgi:hypothetical protein
MARADMTEVAERLAAVETSQNHMAESLRDMAAAQRTTAETLARMADHGNAISHLQQQAGSFDRHLSTVEGRIDGVEKQVKPLESLPVEVASNTLITKATAWMAAATVGALLIGVVTLIVRGVHFGP